jgi:hypothetical protein
MTIQDKNSFFKGFHEQDNTKLKFSVLKINSRGPHLILENTISSYTRGVRSTNGLGIKKFVSKASGGGSRKH